MRVRILQFPLVALLAVWSGAAGQVTTRTSEAAKLVNRWYAEGTAAGNEGDYYDNRDHAHSKLALAAFRQLKKVTYTAEERAQKLDWAMPKKVRAHPIIGNASLATGVLQGGCLPRQAYMSPQYHGFLYKLFRAGNLYVFPEHRDHDPGTNGVGGYGDVIPANTPYLVISQGSSGSDRAFLEAFTLTLAAFRPEVKQKLSQTGMLAPTLQMIFRMSNRHLAGPEDYLTGAAHPTVFEGKHLDEVKMVKMAHDITPETLPPLVQIEVMEQGGVLPGTDAERGPENFMRTPCAVTWVHRRLERDLRLVVSAEMSASPGGEELKYHWVVLRGDSERIEIAPRGKGAVAEITVPWHGRRPIEPDSDLHSNRVDIGVFVHNGHHYSAPAFVSVLSLANETRTYDAGGRLLDIGYVANSVVMDPGANPLGPAHPVSNWGVIFTALQPAIRTPGPKLLQKQFNAAELGVLRRVGPRYLEASAAVSAKRLQLQPRLSEAAAALKEAREESKRRAQALRMARADAKALGTAASGAKVLVATAANRQATAEVEEKQRAHAKLKEEFEGTSKPLEALLTKVDKSAGASPNQLVVRALAAVRDSPSLLPQHVRQFRAMAGPVKKNYAFAEKLAFQGGFYRPQKDGTVKTMPRRTVTNLTAWERQHVQTVNALLLSQVLFPGALRLKATSNYVDPRLGAARPVRDVFYYDKDGHRTGLTHYEPELVQELSAHGHLVRDRDKLGRPLTVEVMERQVEIVYLDPRAANVVVGRAVFDGESCAAYDSNGNVLLDKRSTGRGVTPRRLRYVSLPREAMSKLPFVLDVSWEGPDGKSGWTRLGCEAVQTFKEEDGKVVGRDVRGKEVPNFAIQSVAQPVKSEKLAPTGKLLRYSYRSRDDFVGSPKEVK